MSISADVPPPPTPFTAEPPERVERQSWQGTIAPTYIGLFLWVVFFDRIAVRSLPVGGLGWSVAGAAVGGFLCYRLLYYVPAMWGMRTGYPLTVVSASTFGAAGSVWLAGVMMAAAQVVWFAVSIFWGTELVLKGLVVSRLLDPKWVKTIVVGGLTLQSQLFLITSLVWCCWTALTGVYLVRIISALMKICPIFPALMLALAMLSQLKGLPQYRPTGVDPATREAVADGGVRACLWVVQAVFAFFATAGAAAADWGVAVRDRRDVRLGGWVGVAFAPWVVATLALLTVAGGLGAGGNGSLPAESFTFHHVVSSRVGGWLGCAMLQVFGLMALAPAVYAAYAFGSRLHALLPGIRQSWLTLTGAAAGWVLVATGLAGRLEDVFDLMGAAFAPLVGAMAADYVCHRGAWPGPRRGMNPPGLVAWVMGLAVGLAPLLARGWNRPDWELRPASVVAFATAFVVYLLLAKLGAEAPALAGPGPTTVAENS